MEDVETETHRDSKIWRMLRPRLIKTKKFEDVETETDRDSSKGVETETETESLATHWLASEIE